jgi:hypothetical protein
MVSTPVLADQKGSGLYGETPTTRSADGIDLIVGELGNVGVHFSLHGQYSFSKSPSHHGWA